MVWDGLFLLAGFLLFGPPVRALFSRREAARAFVHRENEDSASRISVIVPARNEADNLQELLPLLLGQTETPYEVIVVDDGSDDGTDAVAARLGAVVKKAERLPEGWQGKSWACWTGALTAKGDKLLFLDADTRPETDFLRKMNKLHMQKKGLVTVQPHHEAPTFREQWSAFCNLVLLAGSGARSGLRWRTDGFGPCALCSKEEYFALGGHERIRSEILEHCALGKQFKAARMPVAAMTGKHLLAFRMYAAGWREMVQGWSKSIGLGAGSAPLPMLLLTSIWLSGLIGAAHRLVASLGSAEAPAALALYGLAVWTVARGLRQCGTFRWYTMLLYPVFLLFFIGLFAYSLLLSYGRKKVVWKGRRVDVK